MFTFHWSELLVVVVCGLVLFVGLALLMLRRRNEILQNFLTPEEPNIEEEFFRTRRQEQKETLPEDVAEMTVNESVEVHEEEADRRESQVQE